MDYLKQIKEWPDVVALQRMDIKTDEWILVCGESIIADNLDETCAKSIEWLISTTKQDHALFNGVKFGDNVDFEDVNLNGYVVSMGKPIGRATTLDFNTIEKMLEPSPTEVVVFNRSTKNTLIDFFRPAYIENDEE